MLQQAPPAEIGGAQIIESDAGLTLGDIVRAAWPLEFRCETCGRRRQRSAFDIGRYEHTVTLREFAAHVRCAAPGGTAHAGRLIVVKVNEPTRLRKGHVSNRDLERIRAMAEAVTPTHQPLMLDDLDAPVRVAAFMPGNEAHVGGHLVGMWAGRRLVAWGLPRKALTRHWRKRQTG